MHRIYLCHHEKTSMSYQGQEKWRSYQGCDHSQQLYIRLTTRISFPRIHCTTQGIPDQAKVKCSDHIRRPINPTYQCAPPKRTSIRRYIPVQRVFWSIRKRYLHDNHTLPWLQRTLCGQRVYEIHQNIHPDNQFLHSKRTLPECNSREINNGLPIESMKESSPQKIKVALHSWTKPLSLFTHIGKQYEELTDIQTRRHITYGALHLCRSDPPTQVLSHLWLPRVCGSECSSGRRECAQVEPKRDNWGESGAVPLTFGISNHGTQPDHGSSLPVISHAAWWILRNSEAIIR